MRRRSQRPPWGRYGECTPADARRDRALERAAFRLLRLSEELMVTRRAEAVGRVRAA